MRKAVLLCIACALLFSFQTACEGSERRGLYVSVIQDPPVFSSRRDITELIRFAKDAGIDTLFVQTYRANKAWFLSGSSGPASYETCVRDLSGDPLRLIIQEAHASGIRVHAWLNLLSLSANAEAPILKKYGPGILTRNLKEKRTLEDYKIDGQYFLEPGDTRVRMELAGVVRDLLLAYPELDGVQFDYLRYPDKDPAYGYTDINMERFKKATGLTHIDEDSGLWKEWKRKQVTELLNMLIRNVRAIRPDISISVTGCASYIRAYYEAYQDWPYWLNSGLVDSVTFMSYTADVDKFSGYIAAAKKVTNDFNKVNIAIGAYKMAGSPGIFAGEMELSGKAGAGGCVILHYESLLKDPALGSVLMKSK